MVDSRGEMPDLSDYELVMTPGGPPPPPPPRRSPGVWIAAAALIAVAVAAYLVLGRRHAPSPPATQPERVEAPQPPVQPLGSRAAPITLPPLDQTDPVVRDLLAQITSHPRVAAWLATDGLIRNFVVVVSIVAEGGTPAKQLRVLRPPEGFRTVARGGTMSIDPASYARYDGVAAAAASLDAAGAARIYGTLKPRIDEAYRELGLPDTPFDRTLERAIVVLLRTPVVEDPVRVEPRGGVGYRFAAPNLDALTAAQKQLVRTGPRNTRIIQSALRGIARALGIPAERLPGSV